MILYQKNGIADIYIGISGRRLMRGTHAVMFVIKQEQEGQVKDQKTTAGLNAPPTLSWKAFYSPQ